MTTERAVQSDPLIRPARAEEAARLSDLAMRSKAHWGYAPSDMEVFRSELTLRAEDLLGGRAFVVEADGRVSGFYTLAPGPDGAVELEHLFVEPDALRGGLGTALFAHARARARDAGHRRMTIQSDPNAAGFYAALGARKVGDIASSIPGRTLPCFEADLS